MKKLTRLDAVSLRQWAALASLPLCAGCTTIWAWEGGFPTKGDDVQRFHLDKITYEYVESGDKKFSRESFEPIFRHATPDVDAVLRQADARSELSADAVLGLYAVVSYAVPVSWPNYVEVARNVVVGASYATLLYLDYDAYELYSEAVATYNSSLERRLAKSP